MARHLKTKKQIDDYVAYVDNQAVHHAPNVKDVLFDLAQEVIGRLNLLSDRIEVFERNGKIARTCWVTITGKRYVFSYDYGTHQIVLRDQSIQGVERFRFDNNVTTAQIKKIVVAL